MKKPCDTDHGLHIQQRQRDGRIIEVDLASFQLRDELWRKRLEIHFQAHGERGVRAHPGTHTAKHVARDSQMEVERIAPEGLVPEGVEAEGLLALPQHLDGVAQNLPVESFGNDSAEPSIAVTAAVRLPPREPDNRHHDDGTQQHHAEGPRCLFMMTSLSAP